MTELSVLAKRRVSVIIVTYQSAADVGDAIASARVAVDHAGVELELIVVDNASADESAVVAAAVEPRAIVIRNAVNVGFGAANNQAFEIATGDAWLLLNPDATVEAEALLTLLRFFDEHPQAAGVAPAVAGGGAREQSFGPGGAESAGMLPGIPSVMGHFLALNRLLPGDRGGRWRGFQLTRRPSLGPRRVEWASAAVLLLRPEAVRMVGSFDTSIFMYGEDVELGERLLKAGWQIWLVPEARAWHRIASSSSGVSTRWIDRLHEDVARRSRKPALRVFDVMLGLSLLARAAVTTGSRPPERLHRRRMKAAGRRALALAVHPSRAADQLRTGATNR
jgi:N-acetylglucosaminyl-diphospho-decaprenol L-rhamnosyltransferase